MHVRSFLICGDVPQKVSYTFSLDRSNGSTETIAGSPRLCPAEHSQRFTLPELPLISL